MLATLFDFPWEERRKLTHWSDVATTLPPTPEAEQKRQAELIECGDYFAKLWKERRNAPPKSDLLSMMAHSDATRDLDSQNFLGNIILLIVGGNDTTRNSLSGGVFALNKFPGEYQKLRDNPALIDSMVPEIIRWQTPLAHMRRTALAGRRTRRQADQEGRQGGDVVCLGQPRRGCDRRSEPTSSSIAPARAPICRSASASTAASESGWPSCS